MLLVTVVFAVGAMLVTYQLRSFKDDVEGQLQSRLGPDLTIGAVSVNGFRGLRIEQVQFTLPFKHGPQIDVEIPTALLNLDLQRLVQGEIVLERVVLEDALINLVRPLDAVWYPPGGPSLDLPASVSGAGTLSGFRIEGANARLRVTNVVNESRAEISQIRFSVQRDESSGELESELRGNLFDDVQKQVSIKARYQSLDEFSVRLDQAMLTHEDAQVFFPSETPFIESGSINPSVRIYGGPDDVIILNLQIPFSNASVADQPTFIEPATGDLNIFASYDTAVQELDITTAKIKSEQITGSIDGSIYFTENFPLFDLQLFCQQLPMRAMVDDLLRDQLEESGALELDLDPQQQLTLQLRGTSDSPIITSEIRSNGGRLRYTPNDTSVPPLDLTLGAITGTWDSISEEATGTLDILDGVIIHEDSGLEARSISGTLTLGDGKLSMNPINAVITDNAIVGSFLYDLESTDATVALNGTLQGIENTSYHDAILNVKLGGALTFKAEARKRGAEYFIDAQVEASQTQLDYMWWFAKPPGVGATGYINGKIVPGEGYQFKFDAEVASSQLSATLDAEYIAETKSYMLTSGELTSSYIDIASVGSCITLPYRITGTQGSYGYVYFEKDRENPESSSQIYGVFVDDINLLPLDDTAEVPLRFENASIEVAVSDSDTYDGSLTLNASSAQMPSFGSTWFIALDPPEEYPAHDRNWTYTVVASELELPPWKGTEFTGEAYSTSENVGFTSFDVRIADGDMGGTYESVRAENSYETDIQWNRVPAHYFLDHLKYDHILSGSVDGSLRYSVDRDDPSTLEGEGRFAVNDGQFSADFLYGVLGGDDGAGLSNLPSKLDFERLSSNVTLNADTVLTDRLRLRSEGMQLEGSGTYIHDGDMDYTIKVALSPDMAETIPSLSENLNLQGFKLSQQDIELGFNIVGPTFNPRGELADLPSASVTLVSGALEVTRDTISIIDTPRKILVDLLKIGGGIIGAGATN